MSRRRAAIFLICGVIGAVFLLSFALVLMVARMDYQIQSYAQLFRLENLAAIILFTTVLSAFGLSVLAFPLAFSARRITRPERRRARGECETCGYDLRGSMRCPECGRVARGAS